jgi:hypothetical protein
MRWRRFRGVPVVGAAARRPDEDFSSAAVAFCSVVHPVEMMQVGLAWQRLARSHRRLITPHCHPVFLPFRFRPSPCEVTRPIFLLRSHIYRSHNSTLSR